MVGWAAVCAYPNKMQGECRTTDRGHGVECGVASWIEDESYTFGPNGVLSI